MSKIIITVEYTYEGVMEHEAEQEAKELAECYVHPFADKASVKSVQVIHQEEDEA